MSDITYLGKTYSIGKNKQYKNITQVAKLLGVKTEELKQLRAGNTTRTLIKPDGENIQINLKQKKTLLLRDFGVKRIANEELIKSTNVIKRNNVKIKSYSGELPSNININVFIEVKFQVLFSEDTDIRKIDIIGTLKTGLELEKYIMEKICDKWDIEKQYIHYYTPSLFRNLYANSVLEIATFEPLQGFNYVIVQPFIRLKSVIVHRNNRGGQVMNIRDMILRDDNPPSISNIYSNIIEDEKWEHCIHDFMANKYKNVFGKKAFLNLNTTNDIYEFCKSKGVKMIAYDINGNCIASNYPIISSKSKYPNLFFVAYNNHLYPMKSQYLNRVNVVCNKYEIITDAQYCILKILESNNYVSDVKISGSKIISFRSFNNECNDYIKYIDNDEYEKCKLILEQFGLSDKIYDNIRIMNLGSILSQLYITNNDNSFFVNHQKFTKSAYVYNNEELRSDILEKYHNDKFHTIDANKFYPSCLKNLDYLITCDMAVDDCKIFNENDNIQDNYLYIVKVKQSSILLPTSNCYSGAFLKYCKNEGLEFEILEYIKCNKIDNHYKFMIDDLYKRLESRDFKMIMNVLIGKFEKDIYNVKNEFIKFCNDDELKTVDEKYFPVKINDNLNMITDANESVNIFNKKPIAIQIKDESRKQLYEMMNILKLDDTNIKSINTDAISYIGHKLKKHKLLGNGLGQWKYIAYKPINSNQIFDNEDLTFINKSELNDNVLGNCYAGAGKSYKIINEYLPKFNNDYIVLTPTRASLIEYKNKGFNCNVIQHYEFHDELPKYKNIIIDEIGLCNRKSMHLIVKWMLLGFNIIAYGDFKQMIPVGEKNELNTEIFKNFCFKNVDELITNYRNNFSKEFYDSIIDGKCDNVAMIKKYRTIDSNNVICYKNKTCDKYNKIIAEKLGIKDKFSIGAKVIVNTNEMRKLDIYNKYVFTVIDSTEDQICLDGDIWIDKKICDKKDNNKDYISLGYARTVYGVQGESMPDFYYPDEDFEYLDDRCCYTVISRLKGMNFCNNVILKDKNEYDLNRMRLI